ncbi:diacylglycerol kinase [Capnocytophaga catalasegens]|uniref:Diacylglycerol kinase n=1 Tax=Capnocytophaga catalasegens TaxID=1004260 RepID=A0AAV5AX87_9FLAO|nr:diacylglycerol kinase family protein [Capnocytophaga catalasegens]GIZ14821.1 diacylglycerol kinase [Capnocytophaga catalasegens]GJM51189.1 diacylglycerol kinase [Capnocytophaga catalasegens]GJM53500.1 diacylglycerol kinase [Capnocytophaga catalasegens]
MIQKFLISRFKSIGYALKGFFILIRTEEAIISHLLIGLLFVGLGFYFDITTTEWLFQLVVFAIVLITEGLNTAVEKICDFVHPDFNSHIGEIKDVSAGAVTFASFFGMIILLIIYFPYIQELFN